MDETIHVPQKEKEMGNIKPSHACFPFKLSLVYIYIKCYMTDCHFRGDFLPPANTFGCYTTPRPQLAPSHLRARHLQERFCQGPGGGWLCQAHATKWAQILLSHQSLCLDAAEYQTEEPQGCGIVPPSLQTDSPNPTERKTSCSKCMFCQAADCLLLQHLWSVGLVCLGSSFTGTQTCSCPRAASRVLAAVLAFHTREIWITKWNLSVFVPWKSKQG